MSRGSGYRLLRLPWCLSYICFGYVKNTHYYGEDPVVKTKLTKDKIEVYLTEREGHFTINLGDTWHEVKEGIHCC
jgi:hypothetical protein